MKDSFYRKLIIGISLLVPALIMLLAFVKIPVEGINLKFFPKFHAALNTLTSILLLTSFVCIKQKKITAHRNCMLAAIGVSVIFLFSYVFYHAVSEQAKYGGTGILRQVYFFILITHILLAAGVLPFVLLTVYRGLAKQFPRHKKIARWTFPVWLYVAVTGVLVYVMMAPYY